MKRLISIALVLVMVLALGTAAFAADPVTPEATVTKEYTITGGDKTPAETLEFEVARISGVEGGDSALPTVGANKDNKVVITSGTTKTAEFPINFPAYSKVGVYTYTITEKEGSTLGVTYDTTPIYVVVTVTNKLGDDQTSIVDEYEWKVAIHKGSATAEKTDDSEFQNKYGLGQLTVTKQVSGNLASNEVAFKIKVTFNGAGASDIAYTVAGGQAQTLTFENDKAETEVELKNGQNAVFTNIPAGVTYTVVEDASHAEGADNPQTAAPDKGYTVTYEKSDDEGKIAAGDADTVTVKNEKKTEVDMGITLDSLPYILIALVAVIAIAVVVIRKRRVEE